MPSNFTVTIRERQRIRIRIAEFRRVPIHDVHYPLTNLTAYGYMFELGDITQAEYENLRMLQIYRQQNITIRQQNINIRQQNITLPQVSALIHFMDEINIPQHNIDALMQFLGHQLTLSGYIIPHEERTQIEHPMTDANPTHERIIEHYGERLAESNNSLCQECLMPIALGEQLCEDCYQEAPVIPNWLFN